MCTATLALGVARPDAQTTTRVRIDAGEIEGVAAGNVVAFKGIPFAAPPVGALRWKAPQPVAPWPGVRPATPLAARTPSSSRRVTVRATGSSPARGPGLWWR